MSDSVLSLKEKAMEFLQTPAGMFVAGAIVFVFIFISFFNFDSENAQQNYASGAQDVQVIVDKKGFEEAWREEMERKLIESSQANAKLERLVDQQNDIIDEGLRSIKDQMELDRVQAIKNGNSVTNTDSENNEENKPVYKLNKSQDKTSLPKDVEREAPPIVNAEDEDFGANPFKDVGRESGKNGVLSGNLDISSIDSDIGIDEGVGIGAIPDQWEVINIGGERSDIRKAVDSESLVSSEPEILTLPAGSFMRGRLLTGVMAPTEGVPWPVLIRAEKAMVGPNGASYPLSGCFLIGNALGHTGTAKDVILPNGEEAEVGRVKIEVTTMTCDWGNVAFDVSMTGYAQDMDGQFGIQGVIHNRFSKELALAVGAAGVEGFGKALLDSAFNVTTVTSAAGTTQEKTSNGSALLKAAGGAAFEKGSQLLQEYLIEKAKENISTIEISSNIKLDFFLVGSVEIPSPDAARQKMAGSLRGHNGMY